MKFKIILISFFLILTAYADENQINDYINKNFNRVIRVSNVSPLLKADFLTPYSIYRIDFRVTDFNDFAYIAYTPDKNVIKIEDPINLFNKLSKPIKTADEFKRAADSFIELMKAKIETEVSKDILEEFEKKHKFKPDLRFTIHSPKPMTWELYFCAYAGTSIVRYKFSYDKEFKFEEMYDVKLSLEE